MSVSLIRTLILYAAVIAAMRLMGKRQIGELEPADLVITILISELATIPMQDPGVPLLDGLVPITVLVALEIIVSFLCLKSRRLRRAINGCSAIIIRDGKLDRNKMTQLRLTTDEVIEALRQNNIGSVAEVQCGMIEPNGQLSYVLRPPYRTVTAEMMGRQPAESSVPLIVVSDGKLIRGNLRVLGVTEAQLGLRIRRAGLEVEQIFLMTLDVFGNEFIQPLEERV